VSSRQSWRRALRKLRRNLSDYGFLTTLAKMLAALFSVVYVHTVYRVYCRDLGEEELPSPPNLPSSIEFRMMDRKNIEDLTVDQIEQMEEWLEGELNRKLREGGVCIVALDGAEVAGFNLVACSRVEIPLVRQTRTLRQNEAWSEQITVHRRYRRHGLGTALRCRMFLELRRRGIQRFYGGALLSNKASHALSRKLGFCEVEDLHYRRLFGAVSSYSVRLT
jgi:GNAT superfamily N-acetyltransferase